MEPACAWVRKVCSALGPSWPISGTLSVQREISTSQNQSSALSGLSREEEDWLFVAAPAESLPGRGRGGGRGSMLLPRVAPAGAHDLGAVILVPELDQALC